MSKFIGGGEHIERISDVNDLASLEEREDEYEGEILLINEELARILNEASKQKG